MIRKSKRERDDNSNTSIFLEKGIVAAPHCRGKHVTLPHGASRPFPSQASLAPATFLASVSAPIPPAIPLIREACLEFPFVLYTFYTLAPHNLQRSPPMILFQTPRRLSRPYSNVTALTGSHKVSMGQIWSYCSRKFCIWLTIRSAAAGRSRHTTPEGSWTATLSIPRRRALNLCPVWAARAGAQRAGGNARSDSL